MNLRRGPGMPLDGAGRVRSPPKPSALNSQPYTLHHTPYTLPPTPYTLHPTPYTLHPTPYTLATFDSVEHGGELLFESFLELFEDKVVDAAPLCRAGFTVQGFGFRILGSGFRVMGYGFRVSGSRF